MFESQGPEPPALKAWCADESPGIPLQRRLQPSRSGWGLEFCISLQLPVHTYEERQTNGRVQHFPDRLLPDDLGEGRRQPPGTRACTQVSPALFT